MTEEPPTFLRFLVPSCRTGGACYCLTSTMSLALSAIQDRRGREWFYLHSDSRCAGGFKAVMVSVMQGMLEPWYA
jgi:hypothetical protein